MSTTCTACGQPVAAGAAFCIGCGQPAPRVCSVCGAPVSTGDKWCATCGSKVGAAAAPAVVPAPQAPPNFAPIPGNPAPAARFAGSAPVGRRGLRRPLPPIVLALAAVVVLAAGALGTGIVKLPGGANGNGLEANFPPPNPNATSMAITEPAAPSGPIEPPPPIDNQAVPVQGQLTLGDASPVQTINLGANGASATIAAPGQSWDGLKVDVPAGAWPGATLQITAQPITASSFGDLVTPISPLYTVSGAEGMAPTPVTLEIPATIPADSFAMGFFYDDAGHLEGMPLLAEDATSVTIATEHFSKFFVSLAKLALLPTTADSGFRPGVDDWQFENLGSYITPDGECAGQSLTEAWYYIERSLKKADTPRLYGLYDNDGKGKTPDLWQDDSYGYRLASLAQTQYEAYTANASTKDLDRFFKKWRGLGFDTLQYNAFLYAIAVTGEPQIVSLSDAADAAGHVMIAYLVTPDSIYVADPNYPAASRPIPFNAKTGKFGTYSSGPNALDIAQGNDVSYVNFVYKAKSALVDWSMLATDWAALDAGTIGDGIYPDYKIMVYDKQRGVWNELTDGYKTDESSIAVYVEGPANVDYIGATARLGTTLIGNGGGKQTDQDRSFSIPLNPGDNDIGFAIWASNQDLSKAGREVPWAYVDFARRRITVGPATSATAATGGHWVLTKTEHRGLPDPSAYGYSSTNLTVDSTNGRIAGSYQTADQQMSGSASWGPPPASAAPGDTWTTTLSADGTCSGVSTGVPLAGVNIKASWWEGSQQPEEHDWGVSASCGGSPGSEKLSWPFPAHIEGTCDGGACAIDIFEQGNAGLGVTEDSWTYHYEWQP